MPKAAPFSPLRLISPAMLVFCFVLFFLPWIEMTCTIPPSKAKEMPKEEVEKMKKEVGIDPTKPVSMVSQSGLQIATGGSSPGSDMKRIETKMKESVKQMGGTVETEKSKDKTKSKDDDVKGAPLLFLYPVLLLAGMGVAFVPIPTMIRRLAVAGCCMAALGVVCLQALIGFPMENEIKKKSEEMKMFGGGDMFGPMGGGGAPPAGKEGKDAKDTKAATKSEDVIRVSWQFALYLTFLLLFAGAGTAFLDGDMGGGGKGRYGRKKKRDDYDDDWDEDEEDERPRKKRRGDDEEDDRPRKKQKVLSLDDDEEDDRPKKKPRRDEDEEDERPKKKPRREEEDEDDRPRKKPRRDEEEEDERPRKKKPAEPDFQMPTAPPPPAAPAPSGPNPFAFDEEEERPKKKRRREEDDDDDDDRPRKRRRRDDDD